ncbi:HalOD1 output domain-containing protein [Haloarchaeobius amylolyticus]|uniref:HalOD1 output domain-containing protein n=1 Tax=Haloarchaeobius amylolyticus TaxID=1198296 RepID=A0ABD6BJI2_9EURY
MPSTNDPTDKPTDQRVTTFDPADSRPSEAVVTAVATQLETDPVELSPLYDVVDPDALDDLVDHAQRTGTDETQLVWFTYEGFAVGVRSDGQVRIRDTTATAAR